METSTTGQCIIDKDKMMCETYQHCGCKHIHSDMLFIVTDENEIMEIRD